MSDTERAKALFFEGLDLCDAGDYAAAEPRFREALALVPGRPSVLTNLAVALLRLRKFEEAAVVAEEAVAADPASEDALLAVTSANYELGRTDQALAFFPRLTELSPDNPSAWLGLGSTLEHAGRPDDAARAYQRLIALDPPNGHLRHALLRLGQGDFATGWAEHEWRLHTPDRQSPELAAAAPLWSGEAVGGRRVLLTFEQGHGDTIQFVRYASLVAELGAEVTLLVPAALAGLISHSFPYLATIVRLAPAARYDFRASLMSLPALLGHASEADIPRAVPYLAAEPDLAAKWRERLGSDGFRVGIIWQGNPAYPTDRTRSVPLGHFAPLAGVPGVRLISLQAQRGVEQLDGLPAGMRVERLGPEVEDNPDGFREIAAAMQGLDLIVASDTAVAHLAGALARPVWLALRAASEWRWLQNRADSPWYPTMRLFRQPAPGDWSAVFGAMADALKARSTG